MASKLCENVEFHLAFKDLGSFMLAFSTCCSVLPIYKRTKVKPNIGLLLYSSLFSWILTSQVHVALRIHLQSQCDCHKLEAIVFCLVYLSKLKRVVNVGFTSTFISSLLDVNSLSQHCLVAFAFAVHMPLYSCLMFYVLRIFYGCPCRKFDFIQAIPLLI